MTDSRAAATLTSYEGKIEAWESIRRLMPRTQLDAYASSFGVQNLDTVLVIGGGQTYLLRGENWSSGDRVAAVWFQSRSHRIRGKTSA